MFNYLGHWVSVIMNIISGILSKENLHAILLFLIIVALLLFAGDTSPAWIYQGF